MVKTFTLNSDSPTERVLHAIIKSYKDNYPDEYTQAASSHPEFFDTQAFKDAVKDVINYYQKDFFASHEDFTISTANVEKVAEFVKDYMRSEADTVEVKTNF